MVGKNDSHIRLKKYKIKGIQQSGGAGLQANSLKIRKLVWSRGADSSHCIPS